MAKIVRSNKAVPGVRQDVEATPENANGQNSRRANGTPAPTEGLSNRNRKGVSQSTALSSGHWAIALHGLISAVDRQHNDATALINTINGVFAKLDRLARQQDELLSAWKITARRQAAIAEEQAKLHLRSTEAIARLENLALSLLDPTEGSARPTRAGQPREGSAEIPIQRTRPTQNTRPKKAEPITDQQSSLDKPRRRRRTKAEMLAYRTELAKIESLGLKRGRGRPKKGAPTTLQIAQIIADSNNP